MNELFEEIKKSKEYQKLKPFEGTLISQWKLTVSLILSLLLIVIVFSFLYLYIIDSKLKQDNLELVFLIIFGVAGGILLIFGSLYIHLVIKNRSITRKVNALIDTGFTVCFLKKYFDIDNDKDIEIDSITSSPEIAFNLEALGNRAIYEGFINGKFRGVPFSFGSITELSQEPLYGNQKFQSLEKAWSSYYRYTVLTFKWPNKLKSGERWNLNLKHQPKHDFLTFNDIFREWQDAQLSDNVKNQIIGLISYSRFTPELHITNNVQTVVAKTYHITNLSDNTGMINNVSFNNEYSILQNLYNCINNDARALINVVPWIIDYTTTDKAPKPKKP